MLAVQLRKPRVAQILDILGRGVGCEQETVMLLQAQALLFTARLLGDLRRRLLCIGPAHLDAFAIKDRVFLLAVL